MFNKDKKELIIEVAKEKGRDTTKYILDGKKYGKNRLVLRIVQKYMLQNTTEAKLGKIIYMSKGEQDQARL